MKLLLETSSTFHCIAVTSITWACPIRATCTTPFAFQHSLLKDFLMAFMAIYKYVINLNSTLFLKLHAMKLQKPVNYCNNHHHDGNYTPYIGQIWCLCLLSENNWCRVGSWDFSSPQIYGLNLAFTLFYIILDVELQPHSWFPTTTNNP